MRTTTFILSLSCFLFSCTQIPDEVDGGIAHKDFPDISGEYFGQEKPGVLPEIFAPFLVSEKHNIHSALEFTPNKKEAYFSIYPDSDLVQKICMSRQVRGKWRAPEIAPFSGEFKDGGPILIENGKRMYFYSKRPVTEGEEAKGDADLWYVKREGKTWSKPVHQKSSVNSSQSEAFLYPGTKGGLFFLRLFSVDSTMLMYTYIENDEFQEPVVIKNIGNAKSFANPVSVEGEDYFIFTRNTKKGKYYFASLEISFRNQDGSWTALKDMGDMINNGEGRFPSISPDGKHLFFVSYRSGVSRFYWVDSKIIDYLRINDLNFIQQLTDEIIKAGVKEGVDLVEEFKNKAKGYYIFDERLWSGAGLNLLRQKENQKALEVFGVNREQFPESALVYVNLGQVYEKLNDNENALENYQKSLDINPGDEWIKNKIEELEKL